MRFVHAIAALLGAMSLTMATAAEPVTASGFSWRSTVTVPDGAAAARLMVPAEAIAHMRSAAGTDLRVFNADGESVPVALLPPAAQAESGVPAQTERLRALPLFRSAEGRQGAKDAVRVRLGNGESNEVWVDLRAARATGARPAAAREMPEVLFDARAVKLELAALRVEADLPSNQLVHFSLWHSPDLSNWTRVPLEGPAFKFDGPGAPANQDLKLRPPRFVEGGYLRLAWELSGVRVQGLTGIAKPDMASAQPPLSLPLGPGTTEADGARVWTVSTAMAPASLRLEAQRPNTLVPVRVLGRNDPKQPWQPLGQGLVFRVGAPGQESVSAPIPLAGPTLRSLRVEATHGLALPGDALTANLEFKPMQLVFLATGRAPFELAVGRTDTTAALVQTSMLQSALPGKLGDLPLAGLAPARIQEVASVQASWFTRLTGGAEPRKVLLWAILAGGVLVLGTVAYSLVRKL